VNKEAEEQKSRKGIWPQHLWAGMSAGDADAVVRVFSLCSKQACRLDFLFLFDQAKRKEEIHTDHLGSYIALTNSSGKIFQRNCFERILASIKFRDKMESRNGSVLHKFAQSHFISNQI